MTVIIGKKWNYYNDFDEKTAAWARELIRRGLVPDGEVDTRSILEVQPEDLNGYVQCHFFCGILGWPLALRLAGWPDDRPVWTGSPPCQPFSAAGRQLGRDDERHLAPHFAGLVAACQPAILFGEQVASAAVFGKATGRSGKSVEGQAPLEWAWLDDLFERLEAAHYACGASDIPAAGVGAAHIRQRTFFGAQRLDDPAGPRHDGPFAGSEGLARDEARLRLSGERSGPVGLADAEHAERRPVGQHGEDGRDRPDGRREEAHSVLGTRGEVCGLADAALEQFDLAGSGGPRRGLEHPDGGAVSRLADADDAGPQGRPGMSERAGERLAGPSGLGGGVADAESAGGRSDAGAIRSWPLAGLRDAQGQDERRPGQRAGDAGNRRSVGGRRPNAPDSPWRDADWLFCRDGKWRPVIASFIEVAYGLSDRMVLCCDSVSASKGEQKEEVDGTTADTSPAEILPVLRGADGEAEVWRPAGGPSSVQPQSLLRPGVHGESDGEGHLPERKPQPTEGFADGRAFLRDLRGVKEASRPPQGRKPFQQRPIELADLVPKLPSEIALAELHGRGFAAQELRALQSAVHEAGALCDTPEQAASAWASLGQEGQDWLRMGFAGAFVEVSFSPLSRNEPARVMRLKGYGNAIVPQAAAEFIKAFDAASAECLRLNDLSEMTTDKGVFG